MNIPVLVGVGMLLLVMIVYLVIRNQKDKKKLEDQLNNDYRKPVDTEDEVDLDEAKD